MRSLLPFSCIAMLGFALLLAGCAQTGQQVRLDPQPDTPEETVGGGVAVSVTGADARPDRRLGVLENRRSEDAEVTTEQDLGELMAEVVAGTLRARGFEASAAGDTADRRLEVRVQGLEHRVSSQMPRRVETRVELAFEAHNGDQRITGRNRHTRSDSLSGRPGPEENAAYIDAAIVGALERLLTDEMLRFLAQPSTHAPTRRP